MNIQRFHAATSREALGKARAAFGEGTLILSNRTTATGVEVVATAEDALTQIAPAEPAAAAAAPAASPLQQRAAAEMTRALPKVTAPQQKAARNPVQEDTEQLAMSTLSFQDYVRERMLRRRHEALNGSGEGLRGDEAEQPAAAPPRRASAPAPMACMATPPAPSPAPVRRADVAPAAARAVRPAPPVAAAPLRGEGVWLEEADGRRVLDCYNNVPSVGHCPPAGRRRAGPPGPLDSTPTPATCTTPCWTMPSGCSPRCRPRSATSCSPAREARPTTSPCGWPAAPPGRVASSSRPMPITA